MSKSDQKISIGVVGGTGKLGYAIARRLAKAGYPVSIGSRSDESAAASAAKLSADVGRTVRGGTNRKVAEEAELVILAVPAEAQMDRLNEMVGAVTGKIFVDTTVPLVPPKVMRVQLPPEGCAAVRAQRVLGEGVRLVSAFHNVAAHKLVTDADIGCDVLVFGDDVAARRTVIGLVNDMQLRGLHGGALANSAAAEALTSVLIFLNKTYKVDGAGLRITGDLVPPAEG